MAIKLWNLIFGHMNEKKWVPIANSTKFPVLVLVKKDTSRYKIMVMVSGIEILR
jgi:hypothetical protein